MTWGGGIDFLSHCIKALSLKSKTQPINLFLLLPEDNLTVRLKNNLRPYRNMVRDILRLKKPIYLKARPLDRKVIINLYKKISNEISIIFYKNTPNGLISCLRQIDADVVLPAITSLGSSFPIPWLGYIYDFQHKYYPQFFTRKECIRRDISFTRVINDAKAVIVNSKAVKNDIHKFYPNKSCRIFNLPFAPFATTCIDDWFDAQDSNLQIKYQLPQNYFIISNQFWMHKSHVTAFEALEKINRLASIVDVEIVCTGKTEDERFPGYFQAIKRKIVDLGVSNKIHFLGYIPKKDQIQIMQNSIAVLQPTLFEGGPGGGSVHNAVTMGVPAIVSDIPVNLEIQEEHVFFFKAGSADDMAKKMIEVLNKKIIRPEKEHLLKKSCARAEILGDTLMESIKFVMAV